MSRVKPPDDISIASLKKKQQTVFNPMAAGTGTPWEDRGTHGTVGAFFKTCFASMASPGKLMGQIRRPETVTDARLFLFGISGIWAISALIHYAYFVWKESKEPFASIDQTPMIVLGVGTLAAAAVGCFFLFKIYNIIYGHLAATEKDSVLLPEVLIYNVNVYAMGPSLLALIPFAGPPIALLWIYIDLIAAGSKRFRLRMPAAVIDALISLAAVLAIGVVGYFVVEFIILNKLMSYTAVDIEIPIKPPGMK
jgi:hypothetical protein